MSLRDLGGAQGRFEIVSLGEQTLWLLGMVCLITSSLLGSINFIVTIVQLRAKGLSYMRLPFFVWSQFITGFLLLLAFLGDFLFLNPRLVGLRNASAENAPQVAMQSNPAEKSVVQDNAMETATESVLAQEAAGASLVSPTETPAPPRAAGLMTTPTPTATVVTQSLTLKSAPVSTETPPATAEAALNSQPASTTAGEAPSSRPR